MSTETKFTWKSVAIDKRPLQKIVEEQYEKLGLPAHAQPTMTPEELQQYMISRGIRPEDNIIIMQPETIDYRRQAFRHRLIPAIPNPTFCSGLLSARDASRRGKCAFLRSNPLYSAHPNPALPLPRGGSTAK